MVRRAWVVLGLLLSAAGVAAAQDVPVIVQSTDREWPVADAAVVRARLADVAPAPLRDTTTPRVVLALFPDVRLTITRQDASLTATGLTWVGEVEGFPGSRAVLGADDARLVGHVTAPFGEFVIRPEPGGRHIVLQMDRSRVARLDDASRAADADGVPVGENRFAPRQDTGQTIDVLVAVTRAAVAGFGSEATARTTVDVAIAEANEALRNSGVPTALRVVHVTFVDHPESGDSSRELRQLQNPSDGVLDSVHTLRDEYAADLVVLVLETFEGNVAGRAYINGPASTGAFGFSAVRRRAIDEEHVFAHEIGHNLGVAHDWYVSSAPGAFSSSKGYTSVTGRVLDIMAYWDLCRARNLSCSQALLYSNPRLSHQGVPMGVPAGTSTACRAREEAGIECDADAVTTMVRMAPVVARFRNSRLALTARRLRAGEWWSSPNGRFRLVYGADGNLQLVDVADGSRIWSTDTAGTTAGQAVIQPDGDFVVVDAEGTVRWSSGTGRNPNAYPMVLDDGVFAVWRADGQPLWSSALGRVTAPPPAPALDQVVIASVTPSRGTVVAAGQPLELEVQLRYTLTSSDVGDVLLHVEDSTGQRIPTEAAAGVAGGSGEVTLRQTLAVPAAGQSFIRVFVLMYPGAVAGYSALTSVTFPVQ